LTGKAANLIVKMIRRIPSVCTLKANGRVEEEVRRRLGKHVIVRYLVLFRFHGNNFVKTILRLAGERTS